MPCRVAPVAPKNFPRWKPPPLDFRDQAKIDVHNWAREKECNLGATDHRRITRPNHAIAWRSTPLPILRVGAELPSKVQNLHSLGQPPKTISHLVCWHTSISPKSIYPFLPCQQLIWSEQLCSKLKADWVQALQAFLNYKVFSKPPHISRNTRAEDDFGFLHIDLKPQCIVEWSQYLFNLLDITLLTLWRIMTSPAKNKWLTEPMVFPKPFIFPWNSAYSKSEVSPSIAIINIIRDRV